MVLWEVVPSLLNPILSLEEMIEAEWLDDVRCPQKHISRREYFSSAVEGATTRAGGSYVETNSLLEKTLAPNTDPLMRAPQGGFVRATGKSEGSKSQDAGIEQGECDNSGLGTNVSTGLPEDVKVCKTFSTWKLALARRELLMGMAYSGDEVSKR